MLSFLYALWLTPLAHADAPFSEEDKETVQGWLYDINELTPYGRLQAALSMMENDASNAEIIAMGSTHPHIAVMVTDPLTKMALEYLLQIPSTERHKLRKGDGIIRKFDNMNKPERKQASTVAKSLGLPKKLVAIRIGSFNGIDITMELSYKYQGSTSRKTITLAKPFTPEFSQQSRTEVGTIIGTKPLPPTDGPFSLMPFGNSSFELQTNQWIEGVGFRFENDEPLGALSVDTENTLDGKSALRFYNTEDTMVFPNLSQSVPVGDAYKLRFQAFVQSKNSAIEYRQDSTKTNITLNYKTADNSLLKSETEEIRLGTYDWEPIIIDSFIPQDASHVEIVLSSSVSGTIWIDGCSLIRME
jgi:hypothetical protein